jgi:hypothetical protein
MSLPLDTAPPGDVVWYVVTLAGGVVVLAVTNKWLCFRASDIRVQGDSRARKRRGRLYDVHIYDENIRAMGFKVQWQR